ncbi:BgTH12-03262 [Blumeria graminis f. sp. triticale]|uniref:BgTH12-03262 n=1 Tax=Blumeria graminis f. sp. triticale TaxID=1689686 RepID=A0A9W4GFI0_BLUGR|nr:BgTH12-03262 [Blumeria graminis f. sp. triticale]
MPHTAEAESDEIVESRLAVSDHKISGPGMLLDPTLAAPTLTSALLDNSNRAHLELGITLALFLWPSLTLAVSAAWGGPDSASKREWFASETIDLVAANPDADVEWIEEFLLNVMLDEFEVNVDDDSAHEVAQTILRLIKDCGNGNWAEVLTMKARWDSRETGRNIELSSYVKAEDDDGEISGSDDEEISDSAMDIDNGVAPQLMHRKESAKPENRENSHIESSLCSLYGITAEN